MSGDPFERGNARLEAVTKLADKAKAAIQVSDIERVQTVLARLPLSEWGRGCELGDAARNICWTLEIARLELDEPDLGHWRQTREEDRKPLAGAVTDAAADWFWLLTEKKPTRVSKRLVGELGPKETGDFAKFLADIFGALGIDAKAAGQVKMWKQRWAENQDYNEGMIHPADFAQLLTLIEGQAKRQR